MQKDLNWTIAVLLHLWLLGHVAILNQDIAWLRVRLALESMIQFFLQGIWLGLIHFFLHTCHSVPKTFRQSAWRLASLALTTIWIQI